MNEPNISVIIPVYNGEKTIRECIQSLQKQSLNEIEILCVDDGSSDTTLSILNELTNSDPRIRVFDKENGGAGSARNLALKNARGEFIAFLDADDCYSDESVLEMLYLKAIEHQALIVGGNLKDVPKGVADYEKRCFQKEGKIDFSDYQYDYLFFRFIYNRKMLIDNNVFFPNYRNYEDPVFMLKAMMTAKWFYAVPIDVYSYSGTHQGELTVEKTIDFLYGLTDNLKLSAQNNLEELHNELYKRLTTTANYYAEKNLYIGGDKLLYALIKANAAVDYSLINESRRLSDKCLPLFKPLIESSKKYIKIRNILNKINILRLFRRKNDT